MNEFDKKRAELRQKIADDMEMIDAAIRDAATPQPATPPAEAPRGVVLDNPPTDPLSTKEMYAQALHDVAGSLAIRDEEVLRLEAEVARLREAIEPLRWIAQHAVENPDMTEARIKADDLRWLHEQLVKIDAMRYGKAPEGGAE